MKTHLIMPMGGAGSRFNKQGYMMPKPLIDIGGKPFFYWATRSITRFVDVIDITFVILQDHVKEYQMDKIILHYFPMSNIIILPEVTSGPVFTCLEGIKNIEDDFPVLFNDCDHMFKSSGLNELLESKNSDIDGALITFESNLPHFSYVKYDNGVVVGTVEKEIVSSHAICGAYYYRSSELFRIIADEYIKNCPYKETFLSGMYNIMCDHNMKVKDFLLDFHVEFGTPEEYEVAKFSKYFNELL